jgi:uncharacterized membrane protein YsdA (DUF1294 family)/cold shock CspA family protein
LRFQGKLTNWNDDKGYGFVEPNDGGDRSFVHIKSFKQISRRPVEGDLIIYEQVKEAKEKYKAVNISLVRDRKPHKNTAPQRRTIGTVIVVSFCLLMVALVSLELVVPEILYLYIVASLVTFIVYAFDKSAAKHGRWRIPESQLHWLALLGGWPGAFIAQNTLRHKSFKTAFKQVYWVTVILNIAAFCWLLSTQGQQLLERILG